MSRATLQTLCSALIKDKSLRVIACGSIGEAVQVLASQEVHVILLDKNLGTDETDPSQNGIEAIPRLLSIQPHMQILMVTGSDDRQDIVKAMRYGAFGYVIKGSESELLLEQIKNAVRYSSLSQKAIRTNLSERPRGRMDFVGRSEAVSHLRRQIEALAKTDTPLLLLGETGTGKTTAAELIHELRQIFLKQEGRPFVHMNMAALPEGMIERELFGAEKGAYSGSDQSRPGLIEFANGGTLFLDEIGDASLGLQAKLLTVLDSGISRRLGSTQYRKSEFRLICATNKNLEAWIKEERFREDLFMRISTISIRIPSLQDRKQDIPEIVQCVLLKCCKAANVYIEFEDIPKDFIEYLGTVPLRGNMRAVEQQIQRLLLFAPRDKRDKPLLQYWRTIPGIQIKPKELKVSVGGLSFEEVMSRPMDVVSHPKFEGIQKFLKQMNQKVLIDARSKFKKNADIAKALGVSEGFVSQQLNQLGLSQKQLKDASKTITDSVAGTIIGKSPEVSL